MYFVMMNIPRSSRAYGDHKHCRKILGRALNSVTDWPEYIVDAYIQYEREEGTLDSEIPWTFQYHNTL